MGNNSDFSDYGSGNSSDCSSMSWGGQDRWNLLSRQPEPRHTQHRAASYADLMTGKCTLEDVMKEFKMNGADCPYTPDDDMLWAHRADELTGMGPSGTYLRQKSWPEPERTPVQPLPPARPVPPAWSNAGYTSTEVKTENPVSNNDVLSEEQLRVLSSLPNAVLYSLLRELEQARGDTRSKGKKNSEECRFCKNNGERESYYRSHTLKDGRGRVTCPVLRAFVCKRCGASGDLAHTIKYCPLSTNEERIKSTAMMRSVRMASGRRRVTDPAPEYIMFGETTADVLRDTRACLAPAPLDPLWAALERKLML